jgi:TetR/AcrR family transcriptional regulator, tetracycline repressor protein
MSLTESPRRARRTRRPLLTRDAVVEAAARVLQRDGYGGLTMRAIADDLGVQAAALYWYVANKEMLETLLYDHLMSGFVVEFTGADWRENIRQAAQQLRRYMRGKRDIISVTPQDFSLGPNSMAQMEGGLTILLAGGLTPRDAAYGFNMLFNYVVNWVEGEGRASGGDLSPPQIAAGLDSSGGVDAALYPNVNALAEHLAVFDADGRFAFGLECMIAGLERRVSSSD